MNSMLRKSFLNELSQLEIEVKKLFQERLDNPNTNYVEKKQHLQIIKNDLSKMKSQVVTNALPNKSHRFVQYENIITEHWGIRHELGKKLLNLSIKYIDSL